MHFTRTQNERSIKCAFNFCFINVAVVDCYFKPIFLIIGPIVSKKKKRITIGLIFKLKKPMLEI